MARPTKCKVIQEIRGFNVKFLIGEIVFVTFYKRKNTVDIRSLEPQKDGFYKLVTSVNPNKIERLK